MAPAKEHAEERRLITVLAERKKETDPIVAAEKRKRGTIIDGILGYTDDGYTVHVPTGRNIAPPQDEAGAYRDIKDDRKFCLWMLEQDADGWAQTKIYKVGEEIPPLLRARLAKTRDSYPGD